MSFTRLRLDTPYPGIRPFREDEEHLFFGREAQVDALVDTLARGRFLAVIGSSGCGKSSLVNCGLRPALHRGLLAQAGSAWRMATCRPGSQPLRALAESLAAPGALHRDLPDSPFRLAELIESTLAMSRRGLVEAFLQAGLPAGTQLLVIVDQFEELFRYRGLGPRGDAQPDADGDPATAFVNLLLEARAQDVPIHVVLTMRSDFLGDCARFAGLPEAINQGQYLVPRMSRDERRAAIAGPARVCGADIAPTLLTRLVNDVGDDPDQLSLLQHALARTWAHWRASRTPSPIEARHYDAVGTLAHALNQHAEELYAALPPGRQRLCAQAFRALTDTGSDHRGVRRPCRFADLVALGGAPAEELATTLAPFRAPGAAFLMPPEGVALTADTVVDLAHESLMRIWDRLRAWGEREAEAARMLRRLADAADLHARGEASLWRDPELQFALDWRQHNTPNPAWAALYGRALAPALAFLDASRDARDAAAAAEIARAEAERRTAAERQRARRALRATLLLGAAALLVAAGSFHLWRRAERAGEIALSRQLAAQSATALAEAAPDTALRLAAAAGQHASSFEAQDSLLAALAQAPLDWRSAGQQGLFSLAVRADGGLIASGGRDGSIRLWRGGANLTPAARLDAHKEQVLALAFSPDGQRLASAGIDRRVILWDVRDPARPQRLAERADHEGPVLAVAFSPDGQRLASAGSDRRIVLRDGHSGQPVGPVLDAHGDTVTGLAFSPDGRLLASTGYDGALLLWATDGTATPRLSASHPAVLYGVAFSPDGNLIATAGADRHVVLWQSTTLAVRDAPLTDHDAAVRAVAFSPDGQRLISVGDDRQVLEHDLTRPTSLGRNHPGHRDRALAVAFTAAGDAFSVGADDRLIHHGQTLGSTLATRLPGVDLPAWALAWSPDGRQLASAGPDGAILLRDALSGAPVGQARRGHDALVTGLAFTPDGTLLASAGQDGRLFLWPVAGGPPRALQPAGEALQTVTVSPDGRTLAAAGRDGHILRWTLPDATPLPRLEHGAAVSDLAFAPDGRRLASAGRDGTLRLWNADGTAADRLDLPGDSLTRIAWPAGDGPLALATRTRGLLQWTPGDAAPRPLGNDEHALLALSFSPDGRQLASADVNGRVRLWDIVSGQAFHAPVQRFPGPVLALAFAPDGRRLAGTGWGGGVQLTPIGADLWSRMACERLRPLPPAPPESACPAPENGRATTSRP